MKIELPIGIYFYSDLYSNSKITNQIKMKEKIKKIGIIILVLIIVWIFLRLRGLDKNMMFLHSHQGVEIITFKQDLSRLKLDLNKLKGDVNNLRTETISGKPALISLTIETYQIINESFTIFIDEIQPHFTGIKIKGGIINTSGVAHQNIEFEVSVAEQTRKLIIVERINSGYSRNFELFIPNVPVEKSEYAKIKFVKSAMAWYKH